MPRRSRGCALRSMAASSSSTSSYLVAAEPALVGSIAGLRATADVLRRFFDAGVLDAASGRAPASSMPSLSKKSGRPMNASVMASISACVRPWSARMLRINSDARW